VFEFLDSFNKRMHITAVVDSIANRRNRDMEIEKLFEEKHFDNLVFSVLVYIMEKTLSDDSECDMTAIAAFLKSILPEFYHLEASNEKCRTIAEYIIKSVLQNDGVNTYFPVLDYSTGTWEQLRIRLIDDKVTETEEGYRVTYTLTDQGYDFLFRTKEIEEDISFSVEEFKLRELLKRKNYKKALSQSINLIQMIRQKKKDIAQFMLKVRENIYDVDIGRFEELINSTYELLQEEYQTLDEISGMVKISQDNLIEEYRASGKANEDIRKAQKEIHQIRRNLSVTLSEQKDLILSRQNLSKIYLETIKEAFSFTIEKRFDFEKEIIRNLEKCADDSIDMLWQLVNSLFMPNTRKHLNAGSIYEPQGIIKDNDEESDAQILQEDMSEDLERKRIEEINDIYVEILERMIEFVVSRGGSSRLSGFIEHLRETPGLYNRFCTKRLLFITILKLYDIGEIDIDSWREDKEYMMANSTGEFSLEYCLAMMQEGKNKLSEISKIMVRKTDEDIFAVDSLCRESDIMISEKIEVTDFLIEIS